MDFIFEISAKKPLRKDSLYIWGKFFVGLCSLHALDIYFPADHSIIQNMFLFLRASFIPSGLFISHFSLGLIVLNGFHARKCGNQLQFPPKILNL